jgi:PKHD-type hydroxylase
MGAKMATAWEAAKTTTPVLMQGGMVVWRGLFTPPELDRLVRQCDGLTLEQARLSGDGVNSIRTTQVAWVYRNAQTEDLYHRMEYVVLRLNAEHFHSDLSGLSTIQYAVYRESEGGYFDWHSDYGRDKNDPGKEPRKLTLSLQLSDGSFYDGCDLEARAAYPLDVAPRERGTLMAFRANVLHRVTPITAGIRKSLVIWAVGPEYR